MMKRLLVIFFLFVSMVSFAQTVDNVNCDQRGSSIVIVYDLLGDRSSDISVSYSTDGGAVYIPLKSVSGAVGVQSPGKGKEIVWDVLNDVVGDFVFDNVIFKVHSSGEAEVEVVSYSNVEQKPKFMGGDIFAFGKWVSSKIVYPPQAIENGIQGRVMVQFTISTDGSVSNVRVLRSVDTSIDKEAVRVVSSSPKWTPGMQNGKPVIVKLTHPVVFTLR